MTWLTDLSTMAAEAKKHTVLLQGIAADIKRIADVVAPLAADLNLKFDERKPMAAASKAVFKLFPKDSGMRADMGEVTWDELQKEGGLKFVVVNKAGEPLTVDPSAVTTTLGLDDNTNVTVAKTDELNYALSKRTAEAGKVKLSATLAYNDASAGPFTATLTLVLPTGTPADLQLIFQGKAA